MLVAIVALPLEVSGGRTEVTTLSDCMLGNVQRRPKDKVEAGSRKYSTRAPGGEQRMSVLVYNTRGKEHRGRYGTLLDRGADKD